MIKCGTCKTTKSEDQFSWRSKAKGQRQSKCKKCFNIYLKRHYDENKQYYIDKAKARDRLTLDKNRSNLWNYLKEHPCVDCGESDPIVLEFDHIKGEKIDCVTNMVKCSFSWVTIEREIEKCEVRCANCHRRKTVNDVKSWRSKFSK